MTFKENGTAAVLVLADGQVFYGQGVGAQGIRVAELCFNTSMTGYQEILTDPSYAGQIIVFTFPHIGNVGINREDNEKVRPFCRGCVVRESITNPSNWRAQGHLDSWLRQRGVVGISGVDTRYLVQSIKRMKAPQAALFHGVGPPDIPDLQRLAREFPGLEGQDLAKTVSDDRIEARHSSPRHPHVVIIDYGIKETIVAELERLGCALTLVSATAPYETIAALNPDAIFLSNGPGDPQATAEYAVPVIQKLLASSLPLFGICLGHQLIALACGGRTVKMDYGHHGANHPVKNHRSGKVEITSQNHGFMVLTETLPDSVLPTHTSLFDHTNEGLQFKDKPVFSVQYHPEASPGPHDSRYLFTQFKKLMHF